MLKPFIAIGDHFSAIGRLPKNNRFLFVQLGILAKNVLIMFRNEREEAANFLQLVLDGEAFCASVIIRLKFLLDCLAE